VKIALNLATRPFTDLGPAVKRLRIGIGVLAGLCLLFLLGLHFFDRRAAAARAREHSLDGEIAHVQAERQRAENMMHLPANAQLLDQVQSLNQIFDAKAFSWTLAMEAMETVLPAGVQVSSIEPVRAKDGHITVHLRVVGGHDSAVELVRNLEHSRRFLLPRIVNESADTGSNAPGQKQQPISGTNRFDVDLLAEYNPPTLEERAALRKGPSVAASAPLPGGTRASRPQDAPANTGGQGRPPYPAPASSQSTTNPAYFRNPNRAPAHTQGGPQ
jgi:type IV pilus assembly protein PilN